MIRSVLPENNDNNGLFLTLIARIVMLLVFDISETFKYYFIVDRMINILFSPLKDEF